MDGLASAGSVLAIDHDRLFKELLTTFFVEFLELFFPKLAETLERDSIEFLSQELFVNIFEGDAYHADIIVKARFKDSAAFFLIHVEHQSTAPSTFPRRFFRYYSAILEKHGLPVYPIVVYSHDAPKKAQPNVYRVDFPDGEVLRFKYRVVQLNRLPWRRFVNSDNPIGSALMAKMKIAERDRPKVKAECLRLMVTLQLNRAKMKLIASFVDAYLNLTDAEDKRFNQSLAEVQLLPKQREEVVEIVTSWERKGMEKGLLEGLEKGIKKGIEKGIEKGRIEGALEALQAVLLDVLVSRFAVSEVSVASRVRAIDTIESLRNLTHRALTAGSLQELGF